MNKNMIYMLGRGNGKSARALELMNNYIVGVDLANSEDMAVQRVVSIDEFKGTLSETKEWRR